MDMPKFAENLKQLMRERRVTAKVLSQATGVPTSTISEWSAGREPKLSEPILKIARFFGVSLEYLASGNSQEANLVGDIVKGIEENFAVIHQGTYRVRIEKMVGDKTGKGGDS